MVYAAPYDICRLQMVCVRQHCDRRCPGIGRHRASGTSAMPDAMGIHVSKGLSGYCLVRTMENAAVADALWSNGVGLHVYVEFYKKKLILMKCMCFLITCLMAIWYKLGQHSDCRCPEVKCTLDICNTHMQHDTISLHVCMPDAIKLHIHRHLEKI